MARVDQIRFLGKSKDSQPPPGQRRSDGQNGKRDNRNQPGNRPSVKRQTGNQTRNQKVSRTTKDLSNIHWEKVWPDRTGLKAAVLRVLNHMRHFIALMEDTSSPKEKLERRNSEYQRVGINQRTPPTMAMSNQSFTANLSCTPERARIELLRLRPEGPIWVSLILSETDQAVIRRYMKYLQS